jgi:hypothetical protein
MATVTIELSDTAYTRLAHVAQQFGKSVQKFLHDWITQLPDQGEALDVTQDPVFQMQGDGGEGPVDLSQNIDRYLYGGAFSK